jgi:hypothetical protein
MSGHVKGHSYAKGPVLHFLDEMSRRPDARALLEHLQRALEDKSRSNFSNVHEAFDQHLFSPLSVGSATIAGISGYLKKHWTDEKSSDTYFPEFQPVAPIVAEGLLKTLELSLAGQPNPKPIDSWWLLDYPDFRVVNLVSPQQVTLLIKTPRPQTEHPTDIWSGSAEGYTTGRHVITHKFENRTR